MYTYAGLVRVRITGTELEIGANGMEGEKEDANPAHPQQVINYLGTQIGGRELNLLMVAHPPQVPIHWRQGKFKILRYPSYLNQGK